MHLSYNKLRIYGECNLKYRYTYVERLPRAPIKTLAAQRKLHAALQEYYHFAAKSGRVDEADLLAAYARACDVAHNPALSDTPAYREGVEILRHYCRTENQKQRAPAMLEQQIKCSFGPYNLQRRIDRLDFAGANSYSIMDYKLDRTVPEQNAAAQSKQLAFYHLLVREGLGLPVQDVRLLYLRHGVEIMQPVTEAGLRQTMAWIQKIGLAHMLQCTTSVYPFTMIVVKEWVFDRQRIILSDILECCTLAHQQHPDECFIFQMGIYDIDRATTRFCMRRYFARIIKKLNILSPFFASLHLSTLD